MTILRRFSFYPRCPGLSPIVTLVTNSEFSFWARVALFGTIFELSASSSVTSFRTTFDFVHPSRCRMNFEFSNSAPVTPLGMNLEFSFFFFQPTDVFVSRVFKLHDPSSSSSRQMSRVLVPLKMFWTHSHRYACQQCSPRNQFFT